VALAALLEFGVVSGAVVTGDPDGDGVVISAGLVADAQAATRRATTIVVWKRESEGRIPMSSGRYVG
jgi:hypothetical protein